MTRSRARLVRPLAPLLATLLAACATAPTPRPSSTPQSVAPDQRPAVPKVLPSSPPAGEPEAPDLPTSEPWSRLRASFAMADCDSDPSIQAWAHRFTANPRRFEQRLAQSLPRLRFIQDVAEKHQVAGEFVLLPWVESRYLPVQGRGRQPAGMWQIVPATAGSLGLRVNQHFDGRMDVAAATEAVMTMLRRYQDRFRDWRLTDYAYNAGEFSVRKLVDRHGAPPEQPVIPKLPVKNVTREHLIKLLAIACVIREPDRFQVRLPTLAKEQHLVAVPIEHPMSMANAAKHAGMSIDALRDYNAAFLNNRIDPSLAPTLMLPNDRVDEFTQAMRDAAASDQISAPGDPAPARKTPSHTVRPGESLWLIARRAGVGVKQLRRWNGLRDNRVHPGQVLRLAAPD
jgi:peptidoglycan lytic transglycosylase D